MALSVEVVNYGSEKRPSVGAVLNTIGNSRDTWYRQQVRVVHGEGSLLKALARIEDASLDLQDLAEAAFELGRKYERAKQEGKRLPPL